MLDFRNRFVFAPIKTGYSAGDGKVTARHLSFYERRSRHVGAVIPEPLYLKPSLREIPTQIGIDSDDKVSGLRALTGAIHSGGAAAIAHLNHPGRMASPKIPGNEFISSTDRPCENGGANPRRMDETDMEDVRSLFVSAAVRAEEAGFDALELQFGHGYLFAQFLSPAVNDRTDRYGGNWENRLRFPISVLRAVREAVGIPIIARLSGDEMIPDGLKVEDAISLASALKEEGVAAVHVSAGTICSTPPWFFQHMFVPEGKTWELAAAVKSAVGLPVVFVGRINSRDKVDRLLNEYGADYLAIGRGLVADPDFIGKYLDKVPGGIRPCLSCAEGCLGGVKEGSGLGCVVNPTVGCEPRTVDRADEERHYAVVGGGLAGMECAITLRARGHRVTLYERDRLGGQFNLASLPPRKESLQRLVDYYVSELAGCAVEVKRREPSVEELASGSYDGVILATGAVPAVPPVAGLKDYYWAEVLEEDNLPKGKKVLVIGGGLIGVEVASKLVKARNYVIIVEMLDEIAQGMEAIEKALTLKSLTEAGVEIYVRTRVTRIEGSEVHLEGDKTGAITGIDHIVLAAGMRSYNPLEKELTGKVPVYVIGDAYRVGKAQDAIRSAYELARTL